MDFEYVEYTCRSDSYQEYKDVNRTYNDAAQTLSFYSSLSPRTDVYSMHKFPFRAALIHQLTVCSIREWCFCTPLAHFRDSTGDISRNSLQIPNSNMGAPWISSRSAISLRHSYGGHGGKSWPARRSTREGLPSVLSWMGRVLGCQLRYSICNVN